MALAQRGLSVAASEAGKQKVALEAGETPETIQDLAAILISLVERKLMTTRDRLSVDFAGSLAADST